MKVQAAWLDSENLQALMEAIGNGFEVYCVGGCVRDAVIDRPGNDIDLATSATPTQVMEAVAHLDVKVLPTGIDHGTVTIVFGNGEKYEVTSYRKDVETDGRRAVIAFAATAAEDAQRRDFTMNALYMDRFGVLLDPTGQGITDLQAKRIRFVGNADDRCREDYLRIMRLFRFHAQLGFSITADAVQAAKKHVEGLDKVSGERKFWELKKVLAVSDPYPAVALMRSTGVLAKVLLGHKSVIELARLNVVEVQGNVAPTWERRYVVLAPSSDIPYPCSKVEQTYVTELYKLRESTPFAKVSEVAYHTKHPELATDAYILTQAAHRFTWKDVGHEVDAGMKAVCPLKAEDLIEAGMVPGPILGAALKSAGMMFAKSGFKLSKAQLMEKVFEVAKP